MATSDDMRMQFYRGVMALGRMEHHLSNSTTPEESMQWMEQMMGGGLPTASPARKKKKKRSSPASPASPSTTSPKKKKKRITKVEQKKKKKMEQQAKAEAAAEAKAARPVSKWNFFLKCCTTVGFTNKIPIETIKAYTAEKIKEGNVNFNDDLARSNLLRKILGPIYREHGANVTEIYDIACGAAKCSDGKIPKQDCDRIISEEWIWNLCGDNDLVRELFEASKTACTAGPVQEVQEVEDDEEVEQDDEVESAAAGSAAEDNENGSDDSDSSEDSDGSGC